MKKILGLILILALVQLSGVSSRAAVTTPTDCPTNYTCSLTASGTAPLVGAANDGHPTSIIGVLNFDGTSTVSGFLAINANGTVANFNLSGVTCVSGSDGSLGQLDFTTSTGRALVFDFVTYAAGAGQGLLVADATASATNSTEVLIGNCVNSPLPAP